MGRWSLTASLTGGQVGRDWLEALERDDDSGELNQAVRESVDDLRVQ
jgi:hypothetical protein